MSLEVRDTPRKVGLDLEQIAIESFLALICLLGPSNEHKKVSNFWTPGKRLFQKSISIDYSNSITVCIALHNYAFSSYTLYTFVYICTHNL